jgi:hypothetical protein
MASTDTRLPLEGTNVSFNPNKDLFLIRTNKRPSDKTCHTKRVPAVPPMDWRMSAGTVVWPLAVMVDSVMLISLHFINCKEKNLNLTFYISDEIKNLGCHLSF